MSHPFLTALALVLTVSGAASAQCSPVAPGLVGWWSGDVDASDVFCGNDGVLKNGAAAGAVGHVAGAFSLDGVDDHVSFPASDFDNASTVGFWLKTSTANQAVIDGGPTFFTWRLGIDPTGKATYHHFRNGIGGYIQLTGVSVISDGSFHFVAFTSDDVNDRIDLHVDGTLEATYTETSVLFTGWAKAAPGDAKLGLCDTKSLPGPLYFQGSVDELDLYDRPLTGPEIQSIFAAGTSGKCPSPAVFCTAGTSASGCVALISDAGSPSATAASGFTLSAAPVEGSKDGLFFFGTSGRQANSWGNGTSYRCVASPVKRAGVMAGSGTPGLCDGSFTQDLNALWCPTCPKPAKNPGAGAVVQAQLWFRDPFNTSNQSTSFSNAIEFCVRP